MSKLYDDNRFENWIGHFDSTIILKGMYVLSPDSVDYYLQHSHGIIISGGNDVQPALYGEGHEVVRCGDLDERRDSLEIKMINYALKNKIPLLGICRGEQILNVSQGGSLIVDIPTDWKDTSVVHRTPGSYCEHPVKAVANTFLASICDTVSGMIMSYHHQAVKDVAPGFRVSAYSPDSLPEAIELMDTTTHPFVLGVQWHPEKMNYTAHLSEEIAVKFFSTVYRRH